MVTLTAALPFIAATAQPCSCYAPIEDSAEPDKGEPNEPRAQEGAKPADEDVVAVDSSRTANGVCEPGQSNLGNRGHDRLDYSNDRSGVFIENKATRLTSQQISDQFSRHFNENKDRLYSFARHLCGDPEDALDLVSETFARIWKYASQPEKYPLMQYDSNRRTQTGKKPSYYTFCRLQLSHIFYDRHRHSSQQHSTTSLEAYAEDHHVIPQELQQDDVYIGAADQDFVEDFLSKLTEQERRIVLLKLEGCDMKEIAARAGLQMESLAYKTLYELRKCFWEMAVTKSAGAAPAIDEHDPLSLDQVLLWDA